MRTYEIDPDDRKTCGFDWDRWLDNEDTTINSVTWTLTDNLFSHAENIVNNMTLILVGIVDGEVSGMGKVSAQAIMADGQQQTRSFFVRIMQK